MMKSSWAFGGCECTELSDFRYYQCSVSLSSLYFTHLPLTALVFRLALIWRKIWLTCKLLLTVKFCLLWFLSGKNYKIYLCSFYNNALLLIRSAELSHRLWTYCLSFCLNSFRVKLFSMKNDTLFILFKDRLQNEMRSKKIFFWHLSDPVTKRIAKFLYF